MERSPNSHQIDARMLRACSASVRADSRVVKAVSHHLSAGGSRVRAHFSLEASSMLGVDMADAITLAAICELLHNASLIHDDLVDRAPMRRVLASVWAQFGDSTAVCAGDLLLATAFALVGEINCVEYLPKVLSLVHQRTLNVILGQDAEQTSNPTDLDQYERVAIGKSASLLSLPFELSLLLSGNDQFLEKAQCASQTFAVAYQMLDDLNDYAEDRQNGSVNAVSVAMDAAKSDYASACALVCSRAQALIKQSIEDAAELPRDSGAALIAYAETMCLTLHGSAESVPQPMEPMSHGG
jgi:geranylgeranyl pyrophosphate synthase